MGAVFVTEVGKYMCRKLTYIRLAAALMVCLSLAQPAFSEVDILGSWVTGLTHAKEAGSNRVLILIAQAEYTSSPNLSGVTYDGRPMSKIIERIQSGSTYVYTVAFRLGEADIAAATSGTIVPTWTGSTPTSVEYISVFLDGVDQTTPIGASTSVANTSGGTLSGAALATAEGDMVLAAATCSSAGTFNVNNDFTKAREGGNTSYDCVDGYKAATGVSETPSVTHSASASRKTLIGFVVKVGADPTIARNPNPANEASGVLITTGLSWDAPTGYTPTSYDVYFGTNPTVRSNPKQIVYTESYDPPGDLEEGKVYFWAVDSNDSGTIYAGDDWSFTTFSPSDRVAGNMMLINDNGGWCWYQDEKIAYDPVGRNVLTSTAAEGTGFGGVNGTRTNDMDFTAFNIDTGKRTRVVHHDFGGDDHNMGAFWIRPDGRYLHIYSQHYNNPRLTYLRLSTNPNDGSLWGDEYTYDWLLIPGSPGSDTGQNSSYTNVVYLSGEGTGMGRLYNIIRVFDRTPCISYSDDWGQNWVYMGRLNDQAGGDSYSNFYHKFVSNGVDRIDFIGVENHPRDNNNSVYHGYIKNGKSYDSFGNEIDTINDQTAPSIQAFTRIFTAATPAADTYHTGWTNEIQLDKDGYPVCLYQTRYGITPWGNVSGGWGNTGAYDHRFFYGRFDGTTWTSTELAKLGVGLHNPEQDYTGMGCIHPNDANIVYISTNYDPVTDVNVGKREIFKGVTPDKGLTWNWTQITFNSTINNTRPAIPQWNADNTAVVWTRGDWGQDNYEDYDLVVVGMVEEVNKTLGLTTYIDAGTSNTTNADDSAFSPTGPSGSAGTADSLWHEYTGYGNGGSCFTAGDGGTENVPTIKTTITGLADGTYDVFAYYWCNPTQDWVVRGGFESDVNSMLCFSRQSAQLAGASQFSGSITNIGTGVQLYRVYIGRKTVSGGTPVVVYLDNYDSTYTVNAPTRTTYDGLGVASVITGTGCTPGDLNCNGKVDFIDFAILGQGWLTTYDMNTLKDIADNWLYGT
jgi:hypothetical protein